MAEFLNDLQIHGAGQIQFKTTAGANAGKIDQDGNNLVLTNAVGDILLGDGSSDVYIGDGTNNVDIIFEQSGSIKGDGSAVTLTLGGANTTLNLENPNFTGNITMSSKLKFTTSNGFILFDYEPSGDTGEYATEVPLIKVDRSGEESTILARISEYRGVVLGADDTVWLRAGDTGSVIKTNVNLSAEQVVMSAEGGFVAYGFPSNDTTWSNRNVFQFYSADGTAANNGLYIGDGGQTQFIDLSRNLKNIGTISSTGDVTITNGNIIFSSQYGVRFNDANTRIYTNTDTPEDLLIEADQDILLTPDGQVNVHSHLVLSDNSYVVSARKFTARDSNGVMLTADDGSSGLSIADNGNATFTGNLDFSNNKGLTWAGSHSVRVEGNILKLNASSGIQAQNPVEIAISTSTSGTTGTTFLELDNNVGGDISQQQTFIDFKFTDSNANYTPQVRIGAQVGPDADADAISKEGAGSFVVYTAPVGSDESGSSSGLAESMRVSYDGSVTFDSGKVIIDNISNNGRIHGTSSLFLGGVSTSLVQLSANLIPDADSSRDLGTTTRYWRDAYIDAITTTGDVTVGDDINISGDQLTFTDDTASAYIRAADSLLIQSDYNTGENKPIYLQPSASTELTIATGLSTFAGAVTVEGGTLELGKADTASGHINAKELMTFNIDTDNDDTNRYFAWYKDSSSGSGTQLLKIEESGNATFAGDILVNTATSGGYIQIDHSDDSLKLADANKIKLGTGNDLQIYHNGTDSYIYDGGVGDLNIVATDLNLKAASDELYLTATSNGAVELYYDNAKKFETTSTGGKITGALTVQGSLSSPDPLLTLYNDTNGGGATIKFGDQSPQNQSGNLSFYHSDGASYGGGASFNLTSTEDDLVLVVGNADATHGRVVVWSGGSSAEVDYGFAQDINTGMRRLGADNVGLVGGGATGVSVTGTATSLRYAGSTKLATTNTGVDITGNTAGTGTAQFSGGSGTGVKVLSIGSSTQTNYTLQDWVNDTHGSTEAYIISYGSGNAQAGNFAMKNLESGGEIFFELASSVEPLRLTSAGITVSGTLTVTGDLDITGDINSTSVNNLDVVDKLITVGKGQTEANSNGSGILVDGSNASLLWDETNNTWDFNKSLDVVGNINASGNITVGGTVDGVDIATRDALMVTTSGDQTITGVKNFTGELHWDLSSGEYAGDPRAVVMGYSGGNYGQLGYNIDFTSTSSTHNRVFNDIPTRIDLHNGIVVYASDAGSAGTSITWTEVLEAQRDAFQYKGQDIYHTGNNSSILNSNVTLSSLGAQASGNYITGTGSLSAQDLTDIGNLSGTNTGDQDLSGLLPKAGGTMTGSLIIDGEGSNTDVLKIMGSARIQMENANATDSFYISNTGGNNVSVLDLGGALTLIENGDATFAGNITLDGGGVTSIKSTGDIALKTSTGEYALYGTANGNTNLYYNGVQHFRTGPDGVVVTGEVHTTGKLGIGTTDPDTDGYSFAEDLVIKGGNSSSDGAGMTILANGKRYGVISFGDSDDASIGEIFYDHTDDRMYFRGGGNNNTLYVDNSKINVSGNITVSGTVDGVDISGLPTFTTVGTNFAQLGDVSVASYIRINADETLSYLNAAQFLSAIGGVDGSAYLPLAGGTMTGTTSHGDNVKSRFGTGNDLSIFASGTTSILDIPAGNFYIGDYETFNTSSFSFARVSGESGIYQAEEGWFSVRTNASNNKTFIGANGGDTLEITDSKMMFYDNMKLNLGSGDDLQIYHDGSNSYIKDTGTGDLRIWADSPNISTASGNKIFYGNNGAAELYFTGGVKKLETTNTGVTVTGNLTATDSLIATNAVVIGTNGTPEQVSIFEGSTNEMWFQQGTAGGTVRYQTDNFIIQGYNGNETQFTSARNGAVELYYDNVKKFETTTDGIKINGSNTITTNSGRLQVNSAFKATGNIVDVNIPCLFNSNFQDGTGSGINVVPFNSLSEAAVSTATYYHFLTMPYAGELKKVVLKNVSGSLGSGFTTQLFFYVNGSQQASSAELSISNSAVTWTPTSNNTFSAGDEISFAYQKSAAGTGITWAGVSFGVAIELTDYDI